jgi:hypothetical protein
MARLDRCKGVALWMRICLGRFPRSLIFAENFE